MSARTAYLGAERDAENMFTSGVTNIEDVSGLTSVIQRLTGDVEVAGFTPIPLPTDTNTVITLALGGTGGPNPPQSWAQQIATAWGGGTGYGLTSPEQGFPTTPQLGHLTFNQSFAQDVTLLNTAIHQELLQGNTITVYGISQSSTAVCLELRNLAAQRYPGVGNLSFILQGDPSNPNGGFLERINGLYVPGLDLTGSGATPTNSPYPMSIYTNQYDLFADLPQYVANPVADLNAFAGLIVGQHNYFPHAETWIHTGTLGDTNFYYALDQGPLPITDLVRMPLAGVGLPAGATLIGDFLQPDLRVLSDLGYGSPFNNAPTEASLRSSPTGPSSVPT